MKLDKCVEVYIDMKHDNGHPYVTSGARLRSFARRMGDVSLAEVRSHHVLEFIEIPETSLATRRFKYGLLRNFFLYCKGRYPLGSISMPPMPPPSLPNSSLPHVYSRAGIRALLRATSETQNRPRFVIPARTYRTFLLFLYGTGVRISEAYQLLLKDVDLKRRMITIRGPAFGRIRIIPIGFDLYRILSGYISFRNRQKGVKADRLFIDKNGRPFQAQTVQNTFQRIRRIANLGSGDNTSTLRMHDLRSSFVVHRLSAWHKVGVDLRTMVPALSAYMGQVGLTSTERYLRLTPERFRHQLNLLSPRQGRSHWRDDERLMSFVAQL